MPLPTVTDVLDPSVFLELVALFTVDHGVDSGNLVFTRHAEAHGLLDGKTENQGHHEGVGKDSEGGNRLDRQLTEVATGEQTGVDREQPQVQRSDHACNQVDANDVK